MEGVAAEANIGLMTLYRHFRTKPALFRVVMETECSVPTLIPDRDAIWSMPVEQALRTFGEAVIEALCEDRQLALRRVVIAEAERFPELGRAWYEGGPAKGVADVSRYIAGRISTGEVNPVNPDVFARLYIALLDRLPIARLMAMAPSEPGAAAREAAEVARVLLGSRVA